VPYQLPARSKCPILNPLRLDWNVNLLFIAWGKYTENRSVRRG
jgi:hypothetical protein